MGELNLRAMELLDAGHTEQFGHPLPVVISLNVFRFLTVNYQLQAITTPEQDLAACLAA